MKKLLSSILASAAVSLALGSASLVAQAQDVKANPQAGEKKAAMCIGCHGIAGYQASFPEVHKVPMISGQGSKYITAALHAYQKGDRKHPTMRSIAASLTEQDIADLSAFYEAQGKAAGTAGGATVPQPSEQVAKALEQGKCVSCHGANFNTPIDGSYPKLAGQHADYLYVALKAYQVSNNANVGRSNAIMAANVQTLTHAQLKAISKYLATLPTDLHVVQQSRFR